MLDEDTDKAVSRVIIYLTAAEATVLRGKLNSLLTVDPDGHEHVSDDTFSKELTICLYDPSRLAHFNDRSKRLLVDDL
jgi:hypothetical protein